MNSIQERYLAVTVYLLCTIGLMFGFWLHWTFLAYVLCAVGAISLLRVHPSQSFAAFHAKQALGLAILALGTFVLWGAIAWVLSWIPYLGFILAIASFALVIVANCVFIIGCVSGILHAIKQQRQPVILVGGRAERYAAFLVLQLEKFRKNKT